MFVTQKKLRQALVDNAVTMASLYGESPEQLAEKAQQRANEAAERAKKLKQEAEDGEKAANDAHNKAVAEAKRQYEETVNQATSDYYMADSETRRKEREAQAASEAHAKFNDLASRFTS